VRQVKQRIELHSAVKLTLGDVEPLAVQRVLARTVVLERVVLIAIADQLCGRRADDRRREKACQDDGAHGVLPNVFRKLRTFG
jgi:hypothetical protein